MSAREVAGGVASVSVGWRLSRGSIVAVGVSGCFPDERGHSAASCSAEEASDWATGAGPVK